MNLSIEIPTDQVLDTVTYSAAYTGKKFAGDETAYERIHTREADREKLQQMWQESAADLAEKFHGVLRQQSMVGQSWVMHLDVPSNFDQASSDGILKNIQSFFINSILGKWFVYTNKEEAGAYTDHAQTFLNAAHALVHERAKPSRPVITDPDMDD